MKKQSFLGICLLMLLSLLGGTGLTANAQNCTGNQWEGNYYNTTDFTGSVVHNACNPVIDFNWGGSAPVPGVNFDNFSVRWTSVQSFPSAGSYQFTVTVEGGVRLFVNGTPLINAISASSGVQNLTANYNVAAPGSTAFITLEMASYTGNAQIKVVWALASGGGSQPPPLSTNPYLNPPTTPNNSNPSSSTNPYLTNPVDGTGAVASVAVPFGQAPTGGGQPWQITFFNAPDLSGNTQTGSAPADGLALNYETSNPAEGINADNWSARLTRNVEFPAGVYTFYLRADDGAVVSIDGQQVLRQERFAEGRTLSLDVEITEGQHTITVEFFDAQLGANLFLTWSPPIGTTLLPSGCNGATAGVNGSDPACPGQSAIQSTAPQNQAVQLGVTVRAGPLFFRPQPTRNAAPLQTIHRGEQYTAIGRSVDNVWVQLNVNGTIGWSMAEFLTLAGDIQSLPITDGNAPTTTTTTTTIGDGTVSVAPVVATGVQATALGHMRIRNQPSQTSDRIGSVPWGEAVNVLGRNSDGKWLQIEYNGVVGWCNRSWFDFTAGSFEELPVIN